MNNIKLRFLGLLLSTLLVFSLFIFGIIYYFVPNKTKNLTTLTDYVEYVIDHKEYNNEFIGQFIINNKLDYYKKEFNKLKEENTSSLKDKELITNEYIHNGSDIDNYIEIGNNLVINHSIITNIQFAYPEQEKTLIIKDSIIGLNVSDIQTIKESHLNLSIDNSFIYLQANNLEDKGGCLPLVSGYINNSLIGDRINYKKNTKHFYFTGKHRGELIKTDNINLVCTSSYYDLKR